VGEGLEGGLAVVCSHATGTHTAEWQLRADYVQHGIVDSDASGARAGDDLGLVVLVARENVKRQGLGSRIDKGDGLLNIIDCKDRQHRAKDFLYCKVRRRRG